MTFKVYFGLRNLRLINDEYKFISVCLRMYALPLTMIYKAKDVHGDMGMWNGISFFLTHELLWQVASTFLFWSHWKSILNPVPFPAQIEDYADTSGRQQAWTTFSNQIFRKHPAMPKFLTCTFQYENLTSHLIST